MGLPLQPHIGILDLGVHSANVLHKIMHDCIHFEQWVIEYGLWGLQIDTDGPFGKGTLVVHIRVWLSVMARG